MRIVTFVIAALLHTVAFAHPADDLANQYSHRLDELRLQSSSPKENADARKLIAAFAKVKAASGIDFPVTFIVAGPDADVFAQAFPGDAIVVNPLLTRFNDDVLVFMLAHELGHVRKHDLERAFAFFAEQIPNNVSALAQQEQYDKLQPQMTAFSHGFEFEADAFAAGVTLKLGYSLKNVIKFFSALPDSSEDSVTHPASVERAKRLKGFQ